MENLTQSQLIRIIEGKDKTIAKIVKEKGELRKELADLRKAGEPSKTMSGKYVIIHPLNGTPHCSEHGAMLCVNPDRSIWRCSTCHIGVDTGNINAYIRENHDVTMIFNDRELVATVKSSFFRDYMGERYAERRREEQSNSTFQSSGNS